MSTPIVFMSHASADTPTLSRLQKVLADRTNGAVDFFLSTIPLGCSWPQEIESALRRAGLMLCFVTPASLQSQWLFFEAGFAYRHGIRVVPLTLHGVTVADLTPPLGLLQGLTLSDHHALNKLMALINDAFGHTHVADFTADDFEKIFLAEECVIPFPSGTYRVYLRTEDGEVSFESLTLTRQKGAGVVVKSAEWDSYGFSVNCRYVGHFKYARGCTVNDMGTHDFTWNGREFVGQCRFDSGLCETGNLIWRPEPAIG